MPREQHYNTPEQAREYLREALAIVDELDPPADLRALVFDKAAQLVAAKAVLQEPSPVAFDFPRAAVGR